jgi:hypothetical protein
MIVPGSQHSSPLPSSHASALDGATINNPATRNSAVNTPTHFLVVFLEPVSHFN